MLCVVGLLIEQLLLVLAQSVFSSDCANEVILSSGHQRSM